MKDEYIQVFKNKAPEGKTLHEKAPTHRIMKREPDGRWSEIASCWPAKSGNGLSCKVQRGVSITVQDPKEVDDEFQALGNSAVSSGSDNIKADDIPFD